MARGRGFGGRGRSKFGRGRFGRGFGGRRIFRGGRSRFRGGSSSYASYQMQIDRIANSALTPVIFNGTFSLFGRDTYVSNHLTNFDPQSPQLQTHFMQEPALVQMMAQPLYQEMTVQHYFPNGFEPVPMQEGAMGTAMPVMIQDISGETYGQQNSQSYFNQQQQFAQQAQFPQEPQYQPYAQQPQQQYQQFAQPQNPYQSPQMFQPSAAPQPQIDPMFANFSVTPEMTDDALIQEMTRRMQQQMHAQPYNGISQLSIVTAGDKLAGNAACLLLTMLCATIFIFPIFFMCCDWWKQIVYPFYNVSTDLYRSLGIFLRRVPSCHTVRLNVCDNNFNAEKGQLLYEALMGSQVRNFTMVNLATHVNWLEGEADNFGINVGRVKQLPITSIMTWGGQTF